MPNLLRWRSHVIIIKQSLIWQGENAMQINNQFIKHYLKNAMFINGTSYAGKSTMVKMLADKYDLIHCGENYDCMPKGIATPETHPNLCYFQTMKD